MKLLKLKTRKNVNIDFFNSTGFENLVEILKYMKAEKIKFTLKLDSSGTWKINIGKVQPDFIYKEHSENEEEQEKEDK